MFITGKQAELLNSRKEGNLPASCQQVLYTKQAAP